jgi:hypothetical protein
VVLCFPLSLLLSIATFLVVTIAYPQPSLPFFTSSLALTCLSALLENLCEPFYLLMLQRMDMGQRVKAEGTSIFVKSVTLYALIMAAGDSLGLMAFALA